MMTRPVFVALVLTRALQHGPAYAQTPKADVVIPSRPETIAWGAFPKDKPPVARIKSGTVVRIDTLSHAGATQDEHPAAYLGTYGVKPDEILKDVLDFWAARATLRQGGTGGGHILTGPIYVEDAAPGDTLEVQILSLTHARAVRHEQHRLERRRVPQDIRHEGGRSRRSRCRRTAGGISTARERRRAMTSRFSPPASTCRSTR